MATRAAKATKRRGKGPAKARPKELELIGHYRKQLAIARRCYAVADEDLQMLRELIGVGKRVAIGGGLYAEIVDPFAAGEGEIIWKHVAVRRNELRITDEDGKEARLRDRRKPARKAAARKASTRKQTILF